MTYDCCEDCSHAKACHANGPLEMPHVSRGMLHFTTWRMAASGKEGRLLHKGNAIGTATSRGMLDRRLGLAAILYVCRELACTERQCVTYLLKWAWLAKKNNVVTGHQT
jgi:hypothetical protein